MHLKLSFTSLAFIIGILPGWCADSLDDYLERQLSRQNVPGMSIAVLRRGELLKAKGYGFADLELRVPATEHTVYQWASVTKQFTAAGVLLLVEDGKLGLDDPVTRYYSEAPPAWSNVTIRHLLTHTSGIKSYTDLPEFRKTPRKDYTPEELLVLVKPLPLEFAPGERWYYNNSGYFLLGLLIEKLSGQSYGEFLAGRIFGPLGMSTARVNDQFELITNRATGYQSVSNRIRRAEFISPTQPYSGGALVGTVLDLARWDAALRQDVPFRASIREEMWRPVKLNSGKTHPYGYGWILGEVRGHPFVEHGGGIDGFRTHIVRFYKDELTVVVLMNGPGEPEQVAYGIADRYVPGISLTSIKSGEDPHPDLSRKLKQCLLDLAAKRDSEIITPQFRKNFAQSKMRHGALQKHLSGDASFRFVVDDPPPPMQLERLRVPVARLCSYRVETSAGTKFYTFELTSDDQVAWYGTSEE